MADFFCPAMPSARNLPPWMNGITEAIVPNEICTWPPTRSAIAGPVPLYGMCTIFVFVICAKTSPARCCGVPLPGLLYDSLPGLSFAYCEELGQRLERLLRVRHQHDRHRRDQADRREVALHVERRLDAERRIDRDLVRCDQQRVAVGRRARHDIGADVAARARLVVDHDGLVEDLRQARCERAGEDVVAAAWRERARRA